MGGLYPARLTVSVAFGAFGAFVAFERQKKSKVRCIVQAYLTARLCSETAIAST